MVLLSTHVANGNALYNGQCGGEWRLWRVWLGWCKAKVLILNGRMILSVPIRPRPRPLPPSIRSLCGWWWSS